MEKGKIFHSDFFLARIYFPQDSKRLSVAAVAPQKIFKTAASRNYMKRKIYEAVSPLIKDPSKLAIIGLFAKSTAINAGVTEMNKDLRAIFVKAGILR